MCFSKKMFQEYLGSLQKNIHPKECDLNFIEITLLHVYSSMNMPHICSRTPFLENTYGELLFYIVLNIKVRKSKYGSKCVGKKLFEIHFSVITTFSNFIRNLRLVVKYQFSDAVVVVDKTRKKGYIYVFGTRIAILSFISGKRLTLRNTSYGLGCLTFRKDALQALGIQRAETILPTCRTILTISEKNREQIQFSNKKCDLQPYFCCLSFLCTRVGSCCTRVVSYYTRVLSCFTRVVSCCTRVLSCYLVFYSYCVVFPRVVFQTRSSVASI